MLSESARIGLYVSLPLYFVLMIGCAAWAYLRIERIKKVGISDHLSAHYLGGRTFGPILSAGTLFASLFSGYTVVGVVNEAYGTGWMSLRWMSTGAGIVGGYVLTGLRLRKSSLVRNHQSPVDFITDRYQCQLLRYTIATLQVITSIIYCAAQVTALKSSFNGIFGLDPDDPVAVIVMFVVILLFEWVGGLSSVALTDAIQGFIMVLSFLMLSSVVKKNFGGWDVLDPVTYPRPEFYQTPSADSQWGFWQFSLLNISFFTLPHLIQRIYAARDLKSLKFSWAVMNAGPWFTLFVSIFLGTMGVQILGGAETSSPFSSILQVIMDLGGFPLVAGVVAFTASLAAIMSTADSLIIAISQLITAEVIYPLRPQATPTQVTWIGRGVSLLVVVLSLLVGLAWKEGVSALAKIQFPLSFMVIPSFLWGLYAPERYDVHPWALAWGAIVSSIYVFLVFFLYISTDPNPAPIDAGVTGMCIHLITTLVLDMIRRLLTRASRSKKDDNNEETTLERHANGAEVLYPGRPVWDVPRIERFGNHSLTPKLLRKMMAGMEEPVTNLWYVLLLFFALSIITPLVPEFEPPINADGTFVYVPAIVNGLPWWALKIIILAIVPYGIIFAIIYKIPEDYPHDEREIAKHGLDPNLVELTPKELGHRKSYDGTNEFILARRSTIIKTMQDLGVWKEESDDSEELDLDDINTFTPKQRRLSALVLGKEDKIVLGSEEPEQPTHDVHAAAKIVRDEEGDKEQKSEELMNI